MSRHSSNNGRGCKTIASLLQIANESIDIARVARAVTKSESPYSDYRLAMIMKISRFVDNFERA
ncbi:hypothetical protein WS98_23075 [Burkholderia territorii]|nr:hypothetical protein WS98_23075 [Burkholderia territorii]